MYVEKASEFKSGLIGLSCQYFPPRKKLAWDIYQKESFQCVIAAGARVKAKAWLARQVSNKPYKKNLPVQHLALSKKAQKEETFTASSPTLHARPWFL
jgi:hypothetical protein